MSPLQFIDRETQEPVVERVFGGNALPFLYGTRMGRCLTWALLSRRAVARFYGWLRNRPGSKRQIRPFVEALDIDLSEAEKPLDAYPTFNAFFSRRLKPEARPVDPDPDVLVSPADGKALVFPRLDEGMAMPVKGCPWSVANLLAGRLEAGWEEGSALVVRLAPADYHRFHFPDDGVPGTVHRIPGRYHSVHPHALYRDVDVFPRNARHLCRFASAGFGDIAYLEIGAMLVGRIMQTYTPGQPVTRGDEKGTFLFGGSTVVLLFEPDRVQFDEDLVKWSQQGLESYVRFGSRIGCRPA